MRSSVHTSALIIYCNLLYNYAACMQLSGPHVAPFINSMIRLPWHDAASFCEWPTKLTVGICLMYEFVNNAYSQACAAGALLLVSSHKVVCMSAGASGHVRNHACMHEALLVPSCDWPLAWCGAATSCMRDCRGQRADASHQSQAGVRCLVSQAWRYCKELATWRPCSCSLYLPLSLVCGISGN